MEFNLPRRKQKDMGIEMGPLMDIVFILLIFFVVTSSFTRETGVDVTKPQAQTASQLEKENLLIAITREGTIHMNERQVDLASLQDILKQSLAKTPDREAVVIADKEAETGQRIKYEEPAFLVSNTHLINHFLSHAILACFFLHFLHVLSNLILKG